MTPEQEQRRQQIEAIRERIHRCDNTLLSRSRQLITWPLWESLSRVAQAGEIDWAAIDLDSGSGRHPEGTLRVLSGNAVLEVPFRTVPKRDGRYVLDADHVAVVPLNLTRFQMEVDASDADWGTPPTVTITLERSTGASIVLQSHSDGTATPEWDAAEALMSYGRSLRERISSPRDSSASV